MAFIPVPQCVSISIEGTIAGQLVVITLSFCNPTGVDTTKQSDLNDTIHSWLETDFMPLLSSSYVVNKIRNTDLSSSLAPVVETAIVPPLAGSRSVSPVPNNVAYVVSFATLNRGRSFRGRNYVPGIPLDDLTSPVAMGPTLQTALLGAYVTLGAAVNLAGLWNHVVISRFSGGAPRTTGINTVINGYNADLNLDSQRRRLAGRGI